ncbi:hypothetical protein F383_19662 [Gossypium arboreum]|uniref:Uncharacterized protein n=1 Tax=Gossypium arboreum TaxID=29729 RepID=A0A0B0MLX8_GOSAR|nr:hypothetical protein F383_19662 [Gossypium arboreum]
MVSVLAVSFYPPGFINNATTMVMVVSKQTECLL